MPSNDQPPTESTSETTQPTEGRNIGSVLAVVIAAIIIGWGALVWYRTPRSNPPPSGPPAQLQQQHGANRG